jgi:hypothetical protein
VLRAFGVPVRECWSPIVRALMLVGPLATDTLQQAPGVAACHCGEPRAQPAVLGQFINALNQDGERKLRNVGGVLRRESILPWYGKHNPLILVKQESPRPDLAFAASPDEISVQCIRSTLV